MVSRPGDDVVPDRREVPGAVGAYGRPPLVQRGAGGLELAGPLGDQRADRRAPGMAARARPGARPVSGHGCVTFAARPPCRRRLPLIGRRRQAASQRCRFSEPFPTWLRQEPGEAVLLRG
ncbi:hypothetical protein GCM10009787_28640 [Streptomyces bangladeshensis]|uniref:Uncharacterized protein n=1 Tax=Streptomyces bangladeshensis TaxID=295352 RepID=A0ABN3BGV4_9ACTN